MPLLMVYFCLLYWEGNDVLENKYKTALIKRIRKRLPGVVIILNDPQYIQAIPDLLILYNNRWAMLETKKNKDARHRPNQDYYVAKYGKMSFAAFIFPENEERVLDEMERSLKS